jgi:hypothetical protein
MEKIITFLSRFLVSEIGSIFFLLIYLFTLMKNNKIDILFIIFFFILFFVSIVNVILSLVFHFMNISIKSSLIAFLVTIIITVFLFYSKMHYENYVDRYRLISERSFIGRNIKEILIFLCLIINQFLVDFYYLCWYKMKKVWTK